MSTDLINRVQKKSEDITRNTTKKNAKNLIFMLDFILSLDDNEIIEAIKNEQLVDTGVSFPMIDFLFLDCNSEMVCNWIVDNKLSEDIDFLTETAEDNDDLPQWKKKLVSIWIERSSNK
jgi:hypothetical protein